uniref:Odorant receptor n=1 Tax=Timema bartmani TaxID=61472 RepID=A0A7R9FBI0_9NEOP|nr:unnamed protein product [Timema bartmani]
MVFHSPSMQMLLEAIGDVSKDSSTLVKRLSSALVQTEVCTILGANIPTGFIEEVPKWKKSVHSLYSVGVILHTLLYLTMILTNLIIEMDNTEDLVYSLSAFLIGFIVFGKLATLLGKLSEIRHLLYIGNGFKNILQFRDYLENNCADSCPAPPSNMILKAYFPFDTTNAVNEIIVFVHQTVGMFFCTMICASIDVFYFTLMAALSVQFEILNETLSHLETDQDNVEHLSDLNTNNATTDNVPITRKSANDMKQGTTKHNTLSTKHYSSWKPNLIDCVQYHQSLLDMSEKMKQLLSPSLYWHYLMISITLCFVGFQAIQLSPASGQFMSTVLFLLCLVSQLGLLCWSADKITVESYKISEVAFGCQWYNASPTFKFCIQNIIRRSQKPVTITAGMFGPLSLKMFMNQTMNVRETKKVENMGMKFVRSTLAVTRRNKIRNKVIWGRVQGYMR